MTPRPALEPVVLAAADLRLRPWREDDARWLEEPDAAGGLIVTDLQPAPHEFAEWLRGRRDRMAAGQGVYWCVADAGTDRPLGHIQVHHLDVDFTHGNGELGYWLSPHARGRGVMGTAIDLVRRHAFAPRTDGGLGLRRLQAGTDIANRASARVLRRAGFRMWGVERSVLARGDEPGRDALNWELLATDDVDAQRVSPAVIPTLEIDGLRLRPWRDDDVAWMPDEPDELARRYLPAGAQLGKTSYAAWLARQRRFADESHSVSWCIADAGSDAALGSVAIFNIGEATATSAEVGYWLLPDARGSGVLPRALEAVVAHAFAPRTSAGLGLTRLYAETDLDNHASQALLRGAGFRRWGEDRQAYTAADGRITDGAYFELLATDDREAQRATKPPVLDFPEVRLRGLRRGDADALAATWADPQVRQWLAVPQEDLGARAGAYVARKRYADAASHGSWWVICGPDGDEFCGVIGLQNVADGSAEVGYWLTATARGHGLATRALEAVCSYAFMPAARGGLGLRRLSAGVAAGNEASARVARRCRFQQIGRARSAEVLGDGSVVDLLLFDRLAGD